jgi:hypothetical protein
VRRRPRSARSGPGRNRARGDRRRAPRWCGAASPHAAAPARATPRHCRRSVRGEREPAFALHRVVLGAKEAQAGELDTVEHLAAEQGDVARVE